ncbi:MAG: hypothetical protein HC803_12015 [Saprospiraceae bacterium]|nr:hypothetical protein [Saprospiraceae bacterium]
MDKDLRDENPEDEPQDGSKKGSENTENKAEEVTQEGEEKEIPSEEEVRYVDFMSVCESELTNN